MDFNIHGLAFDAAGHEFDLNDELEITLSLKNIHIPSLIAVVRNLQHGRYGVEFDLTSKYIQSEDVLDTLDEIENTLNTSHSAISSGTRKMKKRDRYSNKR